LGAVCYAVTYCVTRAVCQVTETHFGQNEIFTFTVVARASKDKPLRQRVNYDTCTQGLLGSDGPKCQIADGNMPNSFKKCKTYRNRLMAVGFELPE